MMQLMSMIEIFIVAFCTAYVIGFTIAFIYGMLFRKDK